MNSCHTASSDFTSMSINSMATIFEWIHLFILMFTKLNICYIIYIDKSYECDYIIYKGDLAVYKIKYLLYNIYR